MGSVTALERSDRRKRVSELYPRLRSIPKVAAEIGCSTTTVWEDLKALEIPRMHHSESLALADAAISEKVQERRSRVGELYERTRSTYKVAKMLGCSRSTVCNDLAALDMAPGQRTKQRGADVACANCGRVKWLYECQVNEHGNFCSRECWGRYRWKRGIAISDDVVSLASGRARQIHKGRWNAWKGAAAGIEAGRAKGGRPANMTPEQQQEILRLHQLGRSTREIAKLVFGDAGLHLRVFRFLRR